MRPKTAQSFHPHERAQTTTTGYIYILTNPSFPQYGKLGYATDVKQRLAELNRSTAVPFAFRVYATYEVDSALSDKKLHSILGKLNPDLRSAEEVDGKRRIREFYAMPPEDAYAILEAIAEINGFHHRLKKWKVTTTAQQDEALARQDAVIGLPVTVTFSDGSAFDATSANSSAEKREDGGSFVTKSATFDRIVDAGDIVSVTVGDVEIPVSER